MGIRVKSFCGADCLKGVRAVYQWSRGKKLTLSIEKYEVRFFTSDTSELGWKPTVEVEGTALPFNPTLRFLGVKYDWMFSFTDQAREAASKIAKKDVGRLFFDIQYFIF